MSVDSSRKYIYEIELILIGPKDSTVEDMWRMIHDTESSVIVMLTNPVESGKVWILVTSYHLRRWVPTVIPLSLSKKYTNAHGLHSHSMMVAAAMFCLDGK